MNDENENEEIEMKVTDSKCFTCKHGMGIVDNDIKSFIQTETVEGNAWEGNKPEQSLSETQLPVKQIRSMCFWRPAGMPTMAPVVFACVSECSRYTREEK
jgi:hypothetical protein